MVKRAVAKHKTLVGDDSMPRYWGVKALAEHLGVKVSWIYDRTRRNGPEKIPHIKLGKYIRFDPESEAFRAWLATHEIKSEVDRAPSYA
jgi:hypothetical protein